MSQQGEEKAQGRVDVLLGALKLGMVRAEVRNRFWRRIKEPFELRVCSCAEFLSQQKFGNTTVSWASLTCDS